MKRGGESESTLSCISVHTSIRNFKSSRKTRTPNNVKTYDETEDSEDHLKIFQAAAHVERWAMPTWCHMFNSTLRGAARVWFDELPLESIDGYRGLKATFLAYFMQQKKYVKDPVEIHNIKQRDGKNIEEFMKRNDDCHHCFHMGETDAASKKKVYTPWKSQDQSKRQTFERRSDFENQPKDGWGSNKFTPLTRTPKEIFMAVSGKFKPPPPMVTPVEKRSSNKFCEFHNDKGHSTDECKTEINKRLEKGRFGQRQSRSHLYDTSMAESDVTEGDAKHYTKAWMNFMLVRSPSPYNGIIGRPGIREIQAVPSTTHGMLKFSVKVLKRSKNEYFRVRFVRECLIFEMKKKSEKFLEHAIEKSTNV
nr:reverse transcriptase domain-containing protein [Tanacetum cinerariifolium]